MEGILLLHDADSIFTERAYGEGAIRGFTVCHGDIKRYKNSPLGERSSLRTSLYRLLLSLVSLAHLCNS